MKLIYTAGPITAKTPSLRFKNCMRAWQYAHRIWKNGGGVICPQFNTLFMDSDDIPFESFMNADFQMILRACDALLMLPGWEDSKGSKQERDLAHENGIPVYYYANLEALYDFIEHGKERHAVHSPVGASSVS